MGGRVGVRRYCSVIAVCQMMGEVCSVPQLVSGHSQADVGLVSREDGFVVASSCSAALNTFPFLIGRPSISQWTLSR